MKTTIAIISMLALLSVSTNTFAQKRSNHKPSTTSSAQSYNAPRSNYSSSNYRANETGWKIGADIVLNKTTFSFQNMGYGSFCPAFFGVADYSINSKMGMIFKAGIDNKQVGFEISNVKADASIDYLTISALYRYEVVSSLYVAAGPAINFNIGNSTQTITNTTTGQRDVNSQKNAVVSTLVSFTIATGYSIEVANNIEFQPSAGYDLFLTSPTSSGSGTMNNLHINAGLRFKL